MILLHTLTAITTEVVKQDTAIFDILHPQITIYFYNSSHFLHPQQNIILQEKSVHNPFPHPALNRYQKPLCLSFPIYHLNFPISFSALTVLYQGHFSHQRLIFLLENNLTKL